MPVRELFKNALLIDLTLNLSWWALQVELLMAPVIVALYFLERRYGPRPLVLIGLVASALAFKPSWAGWPPLSTNLFAFVFGMLVPTIGRRAVAGVSRRRRPRVSWPPWPPSIPAQPVLRGGTPKFEVPSPRGTRRSHW